MSVRVKVDRQGRVGDPVGERERLGVVEGDTLELIATPEGLLLERGSPARVEIAADGLPHTCAAAGLPLATLERRQAWLAMDIPGLQVTFANT